MEEFQDLQNVVHSIEMNLKIKKKKFNKTKKQKNKKNQDNILVFNV